MKIYKIAQQEELPSSELATQNNSVLLQKLEDHYRRGWLSRIENRKGTWMVIPPEWKDVPYGRAWLFGWNDCKWDGNESTPTITIPHDLLERVNKTKPKDIKIA